MRGLWRLAISLVLLPLHWFFTTILRSPCCIQKILASAQHYGCLSLRHLAALLTGSTTQAEEIKKLPSFRQNDLGTALGDAYQRMDTMLSRQSARRILEGLAGKSGKQQCAPSSCVHLHRL